VVLNFVYVIELRGKCTTFTSENHGCLHLNLCASKQQMGRQYCEPNCRKNFPNFFFILFLFLFFVNRNSICLCSFCGVYYLPFCYDHVTVICRAAKGVTNIFSSFFTAPTSIHKHTLLFSYKHFYGPNYNFRFTASFQ
jgi:hypothetical protein